MRHAFENSERKKSRKSIMGDWITMLGIVNLSQERCVIREVDRKEKR